MPSDTLEIVTTRRRFVLPDVLTPNLRVVFCGTAAGKASALARAYYANPGNRFWRALHEARFTPRRFEPHEFAQLPAHGMGLTDLAKHVYGNDDELTRDAFDIEALVRKLARYRPTWVAFTSKNAAQHALARAVNYGEQAERVAASRVFVLPSPSGHAARYWHMAPWIELARLAGFRA